MPLFKQLELPNLKKKEQDVQTVEHIEFNDIRKTGLMGNIDKKKTMMSAFQAERHDRKHLVPSDCKGRFEVQDVE